VHYDAEPARRDEYHRFVADGMRPGFAVEDGVALHFRGTSLERVVSSREGGSAFLVEPSGKRVRETRLPATYLGNPPMPASLEASPTAAAAASEVIAHVQPEPVAA
jgi:hypothetical protein